MTVESNVVGEPHSSPINSSDRVASSEQPRESATEHHPLAPILCPHCLRTASNGIKCKGICVAESDY